MLTALTHPLVRKLECERASGAISRREFLTRATALGLSVTAARSLTGAGPAAAQTAPSQGGTLRVGMPLPRIGDPRTWIRPDAANFARGWLEYLVELQPDGALDGMLLAGWDADASGTTYTLRLRPGVTWSNGEPFAAGDVLVNFQRWCDQSVTGNSMATRLRHLVDPETGQLRQGSVTVLDNLTIEVILDRPDFTFIPSLADYPAAIVHPDANDDPLSSPVGTGPFLPVGEYLPGESAVLERREGWWGTAVVGGPFLDRIEFVDLGPEPSAGVTALDQGTVDILDQSTGLFVEVLDARGYPRSEVQSAATYIIRMRSDASLGGEMPYETPEVRRALAATLDAETILELGYAGRGQIAAHHHVAPLQPDYAEIGQVQLDTAEANAVLEATNQRALPHTLISTEHGWQADTCDVVAAQMRDAGLPVERLRLPEEEFEAGWRVHGFSGTAWGMRPLGVQTLALAYHSQSVWNETGYSNPEFDAALDRAVGISDSSDRRGTMAELQRMLIEDGVIIQPFWRTLVRHARVDLIGADIQPNEALTLYKIGFAA